MKTKMLRSKVRMCDNIFYIHYIASRNCGAFSVHKAGSKKSQVREARREERQESRMGFQETWSMFAAVKVVSSGVH